MVKQRKIISLKLLHKSRQNVLQIAWWKESKRFRFNLDNIFTSKIDIQAFFTWIYFDWNFSWIKILNYQIYDIISNFERLKFVHWFFKKSSTKLAFILFFNLINPYKANNKMADIKHGVAGGLAGIAVDMVFYPLETIKTRIMASTPD